MEFDSNQHGLMVEHQLILAPAITQGSAHLTTPLTQHQHFQRKAFISTRITPGTEGTYILALKTNKQNKIKPKNPNEKPQKINGSVLKKIYFSVTNCHSENNNFNEIFYILA